MTMLDINFALTAFVVFVLVCAIRFLAVRYHISLPIIKLKE